LRAQTLILASADTALSRGSHAPSAGRFLDRGSVRPSFALAGAGSGGRRRSTPRGLAPRQVQCHRALVSGPFRFISELIGCFRPGEVSTFASSPLLLSAERRSEKPEKPQISSENKAAGQTCSPLAASRGWSRNRALSLREAPRYDTQPKTIRWWNEAFSGHMFSDKVAPPVRWRA